MTREHSGLGLTLVAGALLAAPAALPTNLAGHMGSFQLIPWLVSVLATVLALSVLYASTATDGSRRVPGWWRWIAAMSLAAFGPLASESTTHALQADLAFAMTIIAIAGSLGQSVWVRRLVAGVAIAIACGLEATAIAWPIGQLLARTGHRERRVDGAILMVFGLLGLAVALLNGRTVLTSSQLHESAYAIHNDIKVLIPIILLGIAGGMRGRHAIGTTDGRTVPSTKGWLAASGVALLIALMGFPVNVRIAMLAFWWQAPAALHELTAIKQWRGEVYRSTRITSLMVGLVLLAFSWLGASCWLAGALQGMQLLSHK